MKRNTLIYIPLLLLIAVMATGCEKDPKYTSEQRNFLLKTSFGVYGTSSDHFIFYPGSCQYAISSTGKSVRLQADNMTQYVHIKFGNIPVSVDGKYTADIVSSGIDLSPASGSYSLALLKTENDMMWLWDADSKTGFLMPVFE